MIDHLGTRGYDPQQAYAICSCAVDLRMSQAVDVPNFTVSAFLPLDIFTSGAPPRCRDARCSPLNGVSTDRQRERYTKPRPPRRADR
jgi:Acetamidase/Formamidase family